MSSKIVSGLLTFVRFGPGVPFSNDARSTFDVQSLDTSSGRGTTASDHWGCVIGETYLSVTRLETLTDGHTLVGVVSGSFGSSSVLGGIGGIETSVSSTIDDP